MDEEAVTLGRVHDVDLFVLLQMLYERIKAKPNANAREIVAGMEGTIEYALSNWPKQRYSPEDDPVVSPSAPEEKKP